MTPLLLIGLGNRIKCICKIQQILHKRLSSSKRWQARQLKDHFTREAAVQGLKSRAAFKLLQVPQNWVFPC
jgi:21S rRNA (uridine2791-2'-O)-methyltransferase